MSNLDTTIDTFRMNTKIYSDKFYAFRNEVEFVRNIIKSHTGYTIPKDVGAWLLDCVKTYNIIPAIKEIHWCTGLGLKAAKNIFEIIELRYK